jgi:hypothetical protein
MTVCVRPEQNEKFEYRPSIQYGESFLGNISNEEGLYKQTYFIILC